MSKTRGLAAAVFACAVIALAHSAASAADKCLEGASAASDAAQIGAVRTTIDTFCDCDAFDGLTPATTHGKYVKCAGTVVTAKAKIGKLRNECKGFVKKLYAKSRCGFKSTSNGDKVPCVKKLASTGKVTCAVKPELSCTSKPGIYTQAPCSDSITCTDAGDSNANLILDTADSGLCVETLGPIVGTTQTIPSEATPPNTPGTTGVVVTNLGLLAQFGPEFSLNNAMFTRYRYARRSGEPDAILVLVPGFAGGATGFKILAENVIERARIDEDLILEVWAVDRRTNQLEDLVGLQIAERYEDPFVAMDFLFGDYMGFADLSTVLDSGAGAPKRRAIYYNSAGSDTAYMANWTNLVFSQDIDAVIEEARTRALNDNVFLGGHSAGTGFIARYAATDFNLTGVGPAEPGYAKVRGLVLFDGGGGSTGGTPLTADTLDRIEAKANGGNYGALLANAGRCQDGTTPCMLATEAADCGTQTIPKCTLPVPAYTTGLGVLPLSPQLLATVEVAGIQAMNDLEGTQFLLQVDQSGPDTSAIDLVPPIGILAILPSGNVAAGIGNFLDDDGLAASSGAFFVATSLGGPGPVVSGLGTWYDFDDSGLFPACPGAGCITPNNGAAPVALPASVWGQEKEVTRMDRMAAGLGAGGSNFTDWYYPQAGPSTTSVAGVCSGLAGTCTVGNVGAACSGGTQAAANAQCNQSVNLDSTALSVGRGRRDIENLTQAANIDVPVIAFGGSNGLTPVPGNFVAFGNSIGTCAAPSCDGSTPRVVDASTPNPAFPTLGDVSGGFEVYISEGYAHVDVLTGEDDANNQIVGPLTAFLGRNVLP